MLRIAIPSDGIMHKETIDLFNTIGVSIPDYEQDTAIVRSTDFPAELLLVQQHNIPELVSAGMADAGICYRHVAEQKNITSEHLLKNLGLCRTTIAISVPKDVKYRGVEWLIGKTVATPYPSLLERYLRSNNIKANIRQISEKTSLAIELGLADAILDIIPTGAKQTNQQLKQVETVMITQAAIISTKPMKPQKQMILDEILARADSAISARGKKFISMNVPVSAIDTITDIIPSFRRPTVITDQENQRACVSTVMEEKRLWDIIEKLKYLGVEEIVVCPINNIIS